MKKVKLSFNAPVTLCFMIICFLALVAGTITGGKSTDLLFSTHRAPVTSPLMYLRLFTHVFGHSGWAHFTGNISLILLLGPMLEEKYGALKIVEVIAITAVVTGLINNAIFGYTSLCGASGVVFAFILLTSFTEFKEGEIPITFILVVVVYLGQQVYDGLFLKDNISNLSHIIGGIVGAVVGYFFNKKKTEDVEL